MCVRGQTMRDLVVERLVVAADEIFALFERTFAEYEEEFLRTKLQRPSEQRHTDGGLENTSDEQNENPQEQQLQPGPNQPSNVDFLFPPNAVKTEEEEKPTFLQLEQSTLTGADTEGAKEPERSLDLPSNDNRQPFSCSESGDPDGWVRLGKGTPTGDKDMNDFVDEAIPALYKSLFCPDFNDKTEAKSDDPNLPQPFKCSVCGKEFETNELLEKHSFIHNVQSPFRCPVCNKPCSNKSSFKKHLRIHTEERPFRCLLCKKGFSQKCNLKRHMTTHSEEKSFSCPECGLRLRQQHNLVRHISAVHRGERPYSCSVCDKAFAQKTVFIIHMRTHTGEKPFSCALCKKRFRDKCHLTRHVKTHGGQEGGAEEHRRTDRRQNSGEAEVQAF